MDTSGDDTGTAVLKLLMKTGLLDDSGLTTLRQVSKVLRPHAIEAELGPAYEKDASHYQFNRAKQQVEITPIKRQRMLEIAILAYNTAIQLRTKEKPVILYRVAGKRTLTAEEKMQTLSSSVRVRVDVDTTTKEVWPIEKTAAWIQGAMRARVSFVLLNDPREDLVGGVDKKSDAIYVREIYQILSTRYVIGKAPKSLTPTAQKEKDIQPFVLTPPPELGQLPLVPKMSQAIAWDHTWDGSKSSLTLSDSTELIRDYLTKLFEQKGKDLGIPEYPAKSWKK